METVTIEQKELVLEQIQRYCATSFSPEVLATARVDIRDEVARMAKTMTVMLDLPLEPLKEITETTSYKTPLTWFDHLRAQHFPDFCVRKWPIRWKTMEIPVTIKIGAVYPQLPLSFKKAGEVRFHVSKPYGISRQHPAPKEEN